MKFSNEKLIYDIGMHVGNDTAYYLSLGYTVIAIEANPVLVDMGKKKFKGYIANNRLIIIDKGISGEKGIFDFWINEINSEWSSFNKEVGLRNNAPNKKVQVETIGMEELFKEYGIPYYLKVDIEGNDRYCIESILPDQKPKYVSCEAWNIELLDILNSKGYTKFKMINQANGFRPYSYLEEALFLPSLLMKVIWKLKKILDPRAASTYATSGPFGEETKGSWKNYEEVKKEYNSYYRQDGSSINKLSWYDFHATY